MARSSPALLDQPLQGKPQVHEVLVVLNRLLLVTWSVMENWPLYTWEEAKGMREREVHLQQNSDNFIRSTLLCLPSGYKQSSNPSSATSGGNLSRLLILSELIFPSEK